MCFIPRKSSGLVSSSLPLTKKCLRQPYADCHLVPSRSLQGLCRGNFLLPLCIVYCPHNFSDDSSTSHCGHSSFTSVQHWHLSLGPGYRSPRGHTPLPACLPPFSSLCPLSLSLSHSLSLSLSLTHHLLGSLQQQEKPGRNVTSSHTPAPQR